MKSINQKLDEEALDDFYDGLNRIAPLPVDSQSHGSVSAMTRIEALDFAMGLLSEYCRAGGSEEGAIALGVIDRMHHSLIKERVRKQNVKGEGLRK